MMPPPRPESTASTAKPIESSRCSRATTPPRIALKNTPARSSRRITASGSSTAGSPGLLEGGWCRGRGERTRPSLEPPSARTAGPGRADRAPPGTAVAAVRSSSAQLGEPVHHAVPTLHVGLHLVRAQHLVGHVDVHTVLTPDEP